MRILPKKLDNVREAILKVAADMFLKENMDAINMRKIAFKSKIGLGTVYNYFPSKEALLTEIMDIKTNEQFEKIKAVIDSNDVVKEQLRGIYEILRKDFHAIDNKQLKNIISTLNEYPIKVKEQLEEKLIDFHSRVVEYMRENMQLRSTIVARIFLGAIMWSACDKVEFEDVWSELCKLI